MPESEEGFGRTSNQHVHLRLSKHNLQVTVDASKPILGALGFC
jgi:hypothetical protein